MKKNVIIIALVALVGLGYYYLVGNKSAPAPAAPALVAPASDQLDTNPAPAPESLDVTVDIKDFSFNPSTLNIKSGAKVTWTNNDAVAHTITSDVDGIIDSPTIDPGQTYRFTFTRAGTVSYHCNLHPAMKASVVVN